MQIDTSGGRARVVAVLGPTNTGKTYLAMERMLGHPSGMIGFPLRLLARENYDRAVAIKDKAQVALLTGEEKIIPAHARYFICTVESMPLDRPVDFLAVDEIQMCADPDRGHVFTDRLLRARGEGETMFLGAETIRPLIRRLVPGINFVQRPRFSTLSYTGPRNINRLPPRSAVVAFSAADVYTIAEMVRRQRGGAAVVLGALSPRTRNAQVAMYQAGEVDYLVATDAIGMGLNMDVDHVAFAATRKFDGRRSRALTAAELAQIAGRSGRHMNDGTFGTTADIGSFDEETIERIETHRFDPLSFIVWRNADLQFASIDALRKCLQVAPEQEGLVKAREAEDELALALLASDTDIQGLARGRDAVRLLWEVCQIPDFGKVMSEGHARVLARIFLHLMKEDGRLPTDWIADQVARLDRTDGDIEALVTRIAGIRTWTYIAFRGDWVQDSAHWRTRTRQVEDRLSDALHDRLTQRFVDRRTSVLMSRMKEQGELSAVIDRDGGVIVEGQNVGALEGFRFVAAPESASAAHKSTLNAAERALGPEIRARVRNLEDDDDDAFSLADDGCVHWRNAPVGRLVKRNDRLAPGVEAISSTLLESAHATRIATRLKALVEATIERTLGPLINASRSGVAGPARGIIYQLCESFGSMPRARATSEVAALDRDGRETLRKLGVRLGRESIFMPAMLKPKAIAMRALLWRVWENAGGLSILPASGRMSVPVEAGVTRSWYEAVGYRPLGSIAVRVDILERLSARVWSLGREGAAVEDAALLSLAGCGAREMEGVLGALGFRSKRVDGAVRFHPAVPRQPKKPRERGRSTSHSAFAKLKDLRIRS
ncbi:MAG: disulfide oxidoreductase [Rhodospirillales bacterium]|nr:disulfide oxidoreductase [Rhodospirillales bacterium]